MVETWPRPQNAQTDAGRRAYGPHAHSGRALHRLDGGAELLPDTLNSNRVCIGYFLDWCRERSIEDVTEITRPVLERYQRALYYYRKKDGAPLTFRTQGTRLRFLKGWFRWLARQNYLLHNPASELLLPRLENRLPKYILSAEEAEQVLRAGRHHNARRNARPRHPRNVLRNRHAAAGDRQSEALRHRCRPRLR